MDRLSRHILFSLLLLSCGQAFAAPTFILSPSVGEASISDIDDYSSAAYLRIDATLFIKPQLGLNFFLTDSSDFRLNDADYRYYDSSNLEHPVSLYLKGRGIGVTGKWPLHPHVQPYVRADYFDWKLEARALNRTVGRDHGGSIGLAIGVQLPLYSRFGIKAEALRYFDISGTDIDQLALGWTFAY